MRLKNIISFTILFIVLVLCKISVSQNNNSIKNIDKRLYEVYDSLFIDKQMKQNSDFLLRKMFFINNGYKIISLPEGKSLASYPDILLLKKEQYDDDCDLNYINPLKYSIKRYKDKRSIYKIGNTGKIIIFYSEKEFVKKYNNYKYKLRLNQKQ